MKRKIWNATVMAAFSLLLPGCGMDDFFDIQSSMNPPRLTEGREEVKTAVKEYLESDVIWKYPQINGTYSSAVSSDIAGSGEKFEIVFCQSSSETNKVHILFLNKIGSKWSVSDDVVQATLNIEKVYIDDVDDDGVKEIIIYGKNFENTNTSVCGYRYNGEKAYETHISEKALKNITLKEKAEGAKY